MGSFKQQIKADISEYQREYPYISNISKDEWAFNFWVLDKLFFEESELIEDKIIDYHDYGIDAYEFYEDTKEVYLIQNKYYSENSFISADYVKNDFLLRAINILENNNFSKSEELQNFFSKYKKDSDFFVYFHLYVTNNNKNPEADNYIKQFNSKHSNYKATIFYLDEIEEKYYGEVKQVKKNLSCKIESINKGTILNINSDSYKLENIIDARYVFTPIVSIYRIYREAIEKQYPIFDKNIREYLGNKGINKTIYQTLLDPEERKNFFYYNNGITIICDKMHKIETQPSSYNKNAVFTIDNPQIVNGCQTVNSIFEALSNVAPNQLEKEFKDSFVMLKILEIDRDSTTEDKLYKNIVTYNNSQNAIDEKTFVANRSEFIRVQSEFEKKGFLLLIKQSDKNTYAEKYKNVSELKKRNAERFERFGLKELKKASDVFIPLEKLLQVINAFVSGGWTAYARKSNMLKIGSAENNTASSFIKNVTIDVALDLYLLYKRSEESKKASKEKKYPIPYYLIDGFALFECDNRKTEYISANLQTSKDVDAIISLYTKVTKAYEKNYAKSYDIEYNNMIKRAVDYSMMGDAREIYSD